MKKLKLLSYFYSLLLLIALSAIPSRAIEVTVGTGTASSSFPFYTWYMDAKTQILITSAEMGATPPGLINSIAFEVTDDDPATMAGFTIKAQNTALTSLTGFVADGFTTVYSNDYAVTSTGWITLEFTTPFMWDGASNILFELCFDNDAYTGNSVVNATAAPGMTWARNDDSPEGEESGCVFTGGNAPTNRPNVRLNVLPATVPYITASPSNINFNYAAPESVSNPIAITIGGDNLNPASGAFSIVPEGAFEISINNGQTWTAEDAVLNYVGNPIATPMTVLVRFTPFDEANYTGTVTITGGGATSVVNLVGTAILTYCTSNATSTGDQDIGNFRIGNEANPILNNTTSTLLYSDPTAIQTYSDFTTTIEPIVLQGAMSYPVSVSLSNAGTYAYSCKVNVYIDYNRNGIFETPQEIAFTVPATGSGSALTSDTWTGTINVPPTVNTSGPTRMRVVADESDVAAACGTYTWGETEDYLVQFLPAPPYVSATVANNNFGVVLPGTPSLAKDITVQAGALTPASGNLTVTPTENFQISLDGTTWSNAPLSLPYSNGGATLTPSTVKVRFNSPTALGLGFAGMITVTGANAQITGVINLLANNMQTYPASTVSNTSTVDTIDIAKVTLANLAFGAANVTPITERPEAINKYTDNRLAAPELSLVAGSTYQYTVNTYTTGLEMPLCSLGVYIDYNADGDFADAGEAVSTVAIPVANNGVATGSFMVPTSAKIDTNNSPRIRFVLSTGFPSATSTTHNVGETEDYRVKITAPVPMTYASTVTEQVGKDIFNAGVQNEKILRVKVAMNNAGYPLTLSKVVFNTNGTIPTSALTGARAFFTSDTATFNTNTPIALANDEPNGVLEFEAEGIITFKPGNNYIWLAYSVSPEAGLDAILDAELTGLYISDAPTVNKITTPQAPEGFSLVNRLKFDGSFPTANGTTFPYNGGWTNLSTSGTNITWRTVASGSYPTNAPHSAPALAEFNSYGYGTGNSAALITPPFSRTGEGESNIMSLWLYRHNAYPTNPGGVLKVWMNTTPTMTDAVQLNVNGYDNANEINVLLGVGAVTAPAAGWYQYSYTIPAQFNGETNYVLFQGVSDWWNNIQIDDIKIGDDAYMAIAKIDTLNTGNAAFARPSTDNIVNAFNVRTLGSNQALEITNVKFTPEGTTNLPSIANAKVWYLGASATFDPEEDVLFGTVAEIVAGQNTVVRTPEAAAITMLEGNNYFAITYDVVATATAGTIVDCKLNAITVSREGEPTERIITNGNTWGTHEIKLPLSGTYTVGGTPLATRWYPTLEEAADELNALGISGNTDLAIAGNQTFTANQNPFFVDVENFGGNYTLTIYPKDAPRTITGSVAGTGIGVITFLGVDRVVIDGRVNKQGTQRGLTIINNALGFNVRYANSADYGTSNNLTVKYVNFKGIEGSNNADATGLVFAGLDMANISVTNNAFDRISNAVFVQGTDALNRIQNLTITDNLFGNSAQANRVRRNGVRIANTNEVTISNNIFAGLGSDNTDYIGTIDGVRIISGVNGATIKDNKMYDFAYKYNWGNPIYGINVSSNTEVNNINIYNNAISKFTAYGYDYNLFANSPIGIRLAGGDGVKVINNTVSFEGTYAGTGNIAYSACLAIYNGAIPNLIIKNNNFKNTLTNTNTATKSYAIYAQGTTTTFSTIDNNNYYVSGPRGVLGYFGADKVTLSDWQTATTQDASSVNSKVTFVSDMDMHLSGASACNALLNAPLADEVAFDLDGAERTNPTKMGVDEVFADFEIIGQPVSTLDQCVTLGANNTINIPVGTFSTPTYSDGIARTFNVGDLEYSWTKNGEAIAGNSAPLQVIFNDAALPTVNDVYQATVIGLNEPFTSTTLYLSEGPAIYALSGSGSICPGSTVGVNFTLSGSQEGVSYQLRLGDTLAVGTPLLGTGEALTFANVTGIGTYKVLAFNTANPSCVATMTGAGTVNALATATVFNVTRTATAPYSIGLNSSELGASYKLYRDDVEVANSNKLGTGAALDFGVFTQAGVYTVKATKGTCVTLMNGTAEITGASGYTLSGTIKYANTAQTAMNNCVVIIKSGATEVGRATTDATGAYSVSGLANGDYTIEVQTTKAHGGINGLDVSLLRQKIGNTATFTPLQMLAGDINGNGSINGLDVAPLRLKIANTASTQWLVPNFVFYPKTITINGADSVLDIQSLCGGDVNKSFTPSGN